MTMEQGPGKKAPGPVFHVHVPEGAKLELGLQNFGPWTVELSLVDKVSDIEPPAQLQTTDILKGELDYTVSVGASYLIKRSKPPKMFRALERTIVEQLPVVGTIDPAPYGTATQDLRVVCKFDWSVGAASESEQ